MPGPAAMECTKPGNRNTSVPAVVKQAFDGVRPGGASKEHSL